MPTVLRMMSGTVCVRPVGKPVPFVVPEPGHAFWGFPIGGPNELVLVETRFEMAPMQDPKTKRIESQPVDIVMCKIEQLCATQKITPSGRDAFSLEFAVKNHEVANGIHVFTVHEVVPCGPSPLDPNQKKIIRTAGGIAALDRKLAVIYKDRMPK